MSKLDDKLSRYKSPDPWADNDERTTIQRYLNGHQDKKPKEAVNYVGIEIECYGKVDEINLQKMFFMNDLEYYVMIGRDGSIRPPDNNEEFYNTYELRLLVPEKEMHTILKKFGKIFLLARLKVNESCGLHVHLDMRHRDHTKCYEKLKKFEDALFAIVGKDRWNNHFCKRAPRAASDRHVGINRRSYQKHRTLEIRMHHGTTDTNKIEKWIMLLLNVINSKMVPTPTNRRDVLKWKDLDKKLRPYVRRNFKEEWFTAKEGFDF